MLYATTARIDLDALADNLRQVRRLVGDRAIMLAVKGDAYGHGAVPVSRYLQDEGLVDWFGVATVPEGMELQEHGIRLPILKLSPCFPEELDAALGAGLALAVTDATTIEAVEAAAAAHGVIAHVHLKVDTGMGRIGCPPDEALPLADDISACEHLDFQGVFTHLPASDTVDDDAYTRDELARFTAVVARIQDARRAAGQPPVPLVHASNSGAVLAHDLTGLTLVRPGIMAYGYAPDPTRPSPVPLRPVMTLTSRVVAVKRVAAGETVSYGRTWTASVDSWIATVPVGYADGFSRRNSNVGHMLIGGRRYPVAGRVCMDLTMLDLGPADTATPPVQVGDEVIWLGTQEREQITADELAALMGTISYEVVTLVSPRILRVYEPTGAVYQIGSYRLPERLARPDDSAR